MKVPLLETVPFALDTTAKFLSRPGEATGMPKTLLADGVLMVLFEQLPPPLPLASTIMKPSPTRVRKFVFVTFAVTAPAQNPDKIAGVFRTVLTPFTPAL